MRKPAGTVLKPDSAERIDERARVNRRWSGIAVAVSAVLLVAIELFQGALFASPPEGTAPHGVPAEGRQLRMAAVYGGFVREAAEGGGLAAHNHHTAVPHEPVLLRPKEWVVGKTMSLFDVHPREALRVERAFAVPVFVFGVTLLGLTLLRRERNVALFVGAACLGGTLYWLPPLIPGLAERPELWRAWLGPPGGGDAGLAYGYSGILIGAPHLAFEIGWFCLAVGLGIRAARARDARLTFAAGLCVLCLCAVRPYTVPIALTACGAAELPSFFRTASRLGAIARVGLLALVPLPLVVHLGRVITGDTVFSSLDVVHPAPPTHEILLFVGVPAFVLPLVASVLLLRGVRPTWSPATAACVGWTVVQLLMIHGSPVIQWEVEPMLPLLVLVLLGVFCGLERLGAPTWLTILLTATHALGGAAWVVELWGRRDDPSGGLYLLEADVKALGELDATRPAGALTSDQAPVVLVTDEFLGSLTPWLGGVRVVVGHRDHTPDYGRISPLLRHFLATGEGLHQLRQSGATHLYVGPRSAPETRAWAQRSERLELEWLEGGAALLRLDG